MAISHVIAVLAFTGLAGTAWAQCPEPAESTSGTLQADGTTLCWSTVPEQIEVGAYFRIDVSVWTRDGPWTGDIRIDATMPAHGHGMNYLPVVSEVADGRFVADGLLFHMPGDWELLFELENGNRRIRLGSTLHVD